MLGLESVPVLWQGGGKDFQLFDPENLPISCLGGATIEGYVIKNYSKVDQITGRTPLMAKWVRPEFKELNHGASPARKVPGVEITQTIARQVCTPARWEKAVNALRDSGRLTGDERDIGPLIRQVQDDVFGEEEDLIKDMLYAWAKKSIARQVINGLPEWYKGRLGNE